MAVFIGFLVLIAIFIFFSYQYFKITINQILDKLVILDKIFEERYDAISRAIAIFQNYMPEEKKLIFDVQRAKADVAEFAKPKNTKELARKITNENALTLNINYLLDKCDFQNAHLDLRECIQTQIDFIKKIDTAGQEYNKLLQQYKALKEIFPFKYYSKLIHIELDLDEIKTY